MALEWNQEDQDRIARRVRFSVAMKKLQRNIQNVSSGEVITVIFTDEHNIVLHCIYIAISFVINHSWQNAVSYESWVRLRTMNYCGERGSVPVLYVRQGRPSPLGPQCISPCFRFPPIFEKCSDSVKIFQNFTFSRKIS